MDDFLLVLSLCCLFLILLSVIGVLYMSDSILPDPKTLYGTCNYCEVNGEWTLFYKLEVAPNGSHSLPGFQDKISCSTWPYLRCENCKHESRGKIDV